MEKSFSLYYYYTNRITLCQLYIKSIWEKYRYILTDVARFKQIELDMPNAE